MNSRQKKFADLYLQSGVGSASYMTAYNVTNKQLAEVNASKLLKREDIMLYIKEQNELLTKENIAQVEEVKTFWTDIMRDDNYKITDRLKASELLAKTYAIFSEHNQDTNTNITIKITGEEDLKKLSDEELRIIASS